MSNYEIVSNLLRVVAIFSSILGFATFALSILQIVSIWIIYKKAGKAGWESIIPIYNTVVLLQITELPMWYIILYFIPLAQIYVIFKTYIELAHKFGKSTGFGVASVFFSPICLPILAFGKNNLYNGTGSEPVNQSVEQQPINPVPFQNQDGNINTNISNIQVNPIMQPEMNQAPVFAPQPLETNQSQEANPQMNFVSTQVTTEPTNVVTPVLETTQTPTDVNVVENQVPVITPTMPTVETKIETPLVVSEPIVQPNVMPQVNNVDPEPVQNINVVQPQAVSTQVTTEPTNVEPQINTIPTMETKVQPEIPNNNLENNQNM